MKITNINLFRVVSIMERFRNAPFSIKTSYVINKNINNMLKELEPYNIVINSILENYGERNEDGSYQTNEETGEVYIKKEFSMIVKEKLSELYNIEVEINIEPIDYTDIQNILITPNELELLTNYNIVIF